MGLEFDSTYYQGKNAPKPQDSTEKRYGGYGWNLRTPEGVLLAKAPSPQALIKSARVMYDIGKVKNGKDKFFFLYDMDGKLCATVSTKTGFLKESHQRKVSE